MMTSSHEIAPGVWQLRFGEPEKFTPFNVLQPKSAIDRMSSLHRVMTCPLDSNQITFRKTPRAVYVHLPILSREQIYGLGLQLQSFNQKGLKKTLRPNSDPRCDLGDSHAPVPFYVTTEGYGVFVDTARYVTFYCGSALKATVQQVDGASRGIALDTESLYAAQDSTEFREMVIEIPGVSGVDLYIFGGPSLGSAVQRYNLFCGGGCLPPRWALGNWFRVRADFNQDQIAGFTQQLRADKMPFDVIGIEPGWQSRAYACSHVWGEKFPAPAQFVADLRKNHYQINLWTHVFTHSSSPIYEELRSHSGDYSVFGGLVPDFMDRKACRIFANHYRQNTVALGVSGYKLDECDNSDYNAGPWSFPEFSQFPSGLDGEQMHSLIGTLLQTTASQLYESEKRRTFGLIRNSHAFATPYPFALYSDLYDHRQFVRGIVNASFSGLLWCPEVRESTSGEELVRRLQTAVVSPLSQINGWYIANPPWKQWLVEENNKAEFVPDWPDWQERCRSVLNLRMRLVPYLHAAFFRYWKDGIPPFRALVQDYPREEECWKIDDQILMGDRLLAAPLIDNNLVRRIWLPPGNWSDFWTGETYHGGAFGDFEVTQGRLPLFVKSGSVLPLALPSLHTEDPDSFKLEVCIYGDGSIPANLIEESVANLPFDPKHVNILNLAWNNGTLSCEREMPDLKPIYSVASVCFPGRSE